MIFLSLMRIGTKKKRRGGKPLKMLPIQRMAKVRKIKAE